MRGAGYGLPRRHGSPARRPYGRRRVVALLAVFVVGAGAWQALRHRPGAVRTGTAAAHDAKIVRYALRSRFRGSNAAAGGRDPARQRAPAAARLPARPGWRRGGGADPKRVAIGGISMGLFGAYAIARLRPQRFCAVGGHSAAVWLRGGDSAAGAFDDAEDFARHDLVAIARRGGRAAWGAARLWLDGGTEDPFREGGEALAGALGITMRHWPGEHEGDYSARTSTPTCASTPTPSRPADAPTRRRPARSAGLLQRAVTGQRVRHDLAAPILPARPRFVSLQEGGVRVAGVPDRADERVEIAQPLSREPVQPAARPGDRFTPEGLRPALALELAQEAVHRGGVGHEAVRLQPASQLIAVGRLAAEQQQQPGGQQRARRLTRGGRLGGVGRGLGLRAWF
jgi:hypothetical protein